MERMIKDVANPVKKTVCAMNATAKLVVALTLGIAAIVFPTPFPSFLIILALTALAAAAGMIGPFAKTILGFGVPITIMLVIIQGFYGASNVTPLLDLGFATLYKEGLIYALNTVTTLLVFLGGLWIANMTTYTGELVADLTERGLSPKAGYLVLASLNVVPQMQRRMATIEEAQVSRGLDVGGGFLSRIKATVPLIGPVVMTSLTDAEERSMTLETHGFDLDDVKHTSYVIVNHSRLDYIAVGAATLILVIAIVVSVMTHIGIIAA